MDARIAVVIPAYQSEATLARAVHSVFRTGRSDLRAIIVDDGSTDGTAAVARSLVDEYRGHVQLLAHPDGENHGVSASRNLGIRSTHSDWVAFLDADDTFLGHRFDAIEDVDDGIDATYGTTRIVVEGDDATGRGWCAAGGEFFGIREPLRGDRLLEELLRGRCWATSAITIRRSLLERTGLFDPHKRIAEDCDLWMRMGSLGRIEPMALERPVSAYHRHGGNTFHQDVAHRLAVLRALLDTRRWSCAHRLDTARERLLNAAPRTYAAWTLRAALEQERGDVARGACLMMLGSMDLRFLLDPAMLRLQWAAFRR